MTRSYQPLCHIRHWIIVSSAHANQLPLPGLWSAAVRVTCKQRYIKYPGFTFTLFFTKLEPVANAVVRYNFDYLLELTRVSGDFVYCLVQDRMFTIKHDSDSNSRMQMFSTRLIFDETVSNANTWTGKECFKRIVASKESLKGILIAEKSLKRILVSEKLPEHFISTAEFEVKIVSTGSVISSRCRVATIISGTLVSCKKKTVYKL